MNRILLIFSLAKQTALFYVSGNDRVPKKTGHYLTINIDLYFQRPLLSSVPL